MNKKKLPKSKNYYVLVAGVEHWVRISKIEAAYLLQQLYGLDFVFDVRENGCFISLK